MLYLPPFGRQGTRPMGSDRPRESGPCLLYTSLLFLLFSFYKVFLLELPGKHDDPLALHHQVDGGLFEIAEQGERPFLAEIGLRCV